MLIEANTDCVRHAQGAEVVIIGAGTVGVYIAAQCARMGMSVLCVEAGGRVVDTTFNAETARAIGKRHDGITLGRARGLGGTSVLWGGQLVEFEEADLRRTESPWPISFESLVDLYRQTYRELGVPSPPRPEQLVGEAAVQRQPEAREPIEKFYTSWLPDPNLASIYRRDLSTRGKVTVLLGASVRGMGFDGSKALHAVASLPDGTSFRVQGRAFVVACGTIASARLLLHVARGENIPWRTNDNVGCYFQNHLGGRVASVNLRDKVRFRRLFENVFVHGAKLQPKLRWSSEGRAAAPTGVAGLFSFDSEIGENLANVKMVARSLRKGAQYSSLARLPRDLFAIGRVFVPIVAHYVKERRIMALFDRGLYFLVQAEQVPLRESRLSLGEEACRDGMPPVKVDWRVDGTELHRSEISPCKCGKLWLAWELPIFPSTSSS